MDGLCLKAGIHGITTPITVAGIGALNVRTNPTHVVSAVGSWSSSAGNSISAEKPPAPTRTTSSWGFSFGQSLRSLWPGSGGLNRHDAIAVNEAVSVEETEERKDNLESAEEARDGDGGSWVLNIMHMRSLWRDELEWNGSEEDLELAEEQEEKDKRVVNENGGEVGSENCNVCDAECDDGCEVDDHGETIQFDNDSFSRLLKRVSLAEAKLYSQMAYLGNLAYSIPKIKPGRLLKYHGLRFVTSSLEKKEQQPLKAEKGKVSSEIQEAKESTKELIEDKEERISRNNISASTAYRIAASAASYLHSHTRSIIPFKSLKAKASKSLLENGIGSTDNVHTMNQEVASLIATTDSVTAVVAAKEEVKQAVADDLSSTRSSPCEWFICDDDRSATRFFIIQGSESLASWKANLLFEPVQFEGLNVLVHRGIYEAAKGIYEQMLPEVRSHLNSQGDRATFRFTGHSLGGSLSLLINLMLLIRSEVSLSSLLPVITFGAPSIMCGGNRLLRDLGLPQNHLQAITMHRDIVPRAFSCNYPSHVAEFLKAVNWNFRNHPCLNKQKLLYAPMGECLILQPEEKLSPNHHLLPSGSGLYLLCCPVLDASEAEKQIRAALSVFLNSPHPLEILSDRSAYGSEGTIQRDHDMDSYTRSLRKVYRQELNLIKKVRKEQRHKIWWPLVILHDINSGFILGRPVGTFARDQVNFYGIVGTSRESWKQFNRLVSSRHVHMLMVILLPAQLLILGVYRLYRVIRLC